MNRRELLQSFTTVAASAGIVANVSALGSQDKLPLLLHVDIGDNKAEPSFLNELEKLRDQIHENSGYKVTLLVTNSRKPITVTLTEAP